MPLTFFLVLLPAELINTDGRVLMVLMILRPVVWEFHGDLDVTSVWLMILDLVLFYKGLWLSKAGVFTGSSLESSELFMELERDIRILP